MKKIFIPLLVTAAIWSFSTDALAQSKELSLRDMLQAASSNNKLLQIHRLEQSKTEALIKETKAYLLPSLQLNSSYTAFTEKPVIYLRNENADPKVADIKYGGHLAFDAYLQATYDLTNPTVKLKIQSQQIQAKQNEQEKRLAEEKLALDISTLYYSVLFYEKQKKVLQQSIIRNQQALRDTRNLFEQGRMLKTDTLSQYIAVQNIGSALFSIDHQIHTTLLQLKHLTGTDAEAEVTLTDTLSSFISLLQVDTVKTNNRADMQLADLLLQREKKKYETIKTAYKPRLMSFAQYQVQTQADNFQFSQYRLPRTSFIGVRLQIPIYTGNRIKHQSAAGQITIKQQELVMSDLAQKIQLEQAELYSQLAAEIKQWQVQVKNISSAQTGYEIVYERYRAGLSTRLDLADAELLLTKARMEEVRSTYKINLLQIQLQKSNGLLHL